MKKIIILSLLISSFLVFSPISKTSAAKNVKINPSDENIVLDWDDTGKRYEIYEYDKLIWNGSESKAVISNLEPKEIYTFTIISYDKNNEKNLVSKITTRTEAKNKSYSAMSTVDIPSIGDGFIDAVVNSDGISLSLRNSIIDEHDGKVEIYKNDELMVSTTEKTFTDTKISEGETYNYKFVLRKKISDADIKKAKQQLNKEDIEITPEIEEELFYEPYEYIKIVTVPKVSIEPFWEPPAPPATNQLGFKYNTFIPDDLVSAHSIVDGWTKGYQFGGDNRGFNFNKGTSRTVAEAVVTFSSQNPTLKERKIIEKTNLYDSNGKWLKSSPGVGTINFLQGTTTKDKLYFRINHSAQVGFSDFGKLVPNIDYAADIVAYRDGSIYIKGSRDQAPSHELYVYWPYSEGLFPVFQASNKGFRYLSPLYPQAKFNVGQLK